MKRRKFFLTTLLAAIAPALFAKAQSLLPRAGKGFKVAGGESRNGEHFKMRGVTANNLDLKVSAQDTDGDLALFEQTGFTLQGGPPLHIHPEQDEFFYILEGEYRFQVGDDKFEMRAGDTIFLPRAVPHAFIQLTEKARVLVGYQPAGQMEAFFRLTASWTTPPTPQQVAEAFATHGMKVVGPPLKAE